MRFLAQFRGELTKLLRRRRTWLGFGAFAALEMLIPGLFHLPNVSASFRDLIESRGHSFDEYFSGLTLALLTMRTTVFFICTLFLAMVGGEIVAKEIEDGTMRMVFCRPVERLRIIAMKYAAVALYTIALVWFIGLMALSTGMLYAGPGGFFAFGFQEYTSTFHPFGEGLARYFSVLPFLSLSLLTVTSIAFMFSCFDMKPATAAIATLAIFFTDLVFRGIPFFGSFRSWLITSRMSGWMLIFQPEIAWGEIIVDYTMLVALQGTCVVIGWAAFEWREFKS